MVSQLRYDLRHIPCHVLRSIFNMLVLSGLDIKPSVLATEMYSLCVCVFLLVLVLVANAVARRNLVRSCGTVHYFYTFPSKDDTVQNISRRV